MSVMIENKEYDGESYLTIDISGCWLWQGTVPVLDRASSQFKVGREIGTVDFSVEDIPISIAMILLGIPTTMQGVDFRRNFKSKEPSIFKLEATTI